MSSKCASCERRFVKGDRKTKYNGLEYHQDCFICSSCHQPIKKSFYNMGNNEFRCSDCQNQLQSMVICRQCSKPIEDESYIEHKNQPMHSECFLCCLCSQPLENMLFVEHDNQPYCVKCHMDKFAQTCAICERAFPPGTSMRKHDNQYFHIECFRCFHCGNVILTKNYVVNSEQQRLCNMCI